MLLPKVEPPCYMLPLVLLPLLLCSTPHAVAMAREEVALMREIDHPNIVKVFECFDDTAYFFVVSVHPVFSTFSIWIL